MNSTLPKINVLTILKEAKEAEMCRDLEYEIKVLRPIWSNLDESPDLTSFDPIVRASLLSICGKFLSNYGRAKQISDYQERGKDLITAAIEIFEEFDCRDKVAEAKGHMAMCYWHEGNIAEADAFLQDAEENFQYNKHHPIYLQIQVNRIIGLFWNEKYAEAEKIIDSLKKPMEQSSEYPLKAMFHNQVGIIYRATGKLSDAFYNYREAIRFAKKGGNLRFVAKISNNLAYSLTINGEFEEAEWLIDKALTIFSDLSDSGWRANVLDTKARLRLAQCRYDEAQAIIDESLLLLKQSGDMLSLIDSLWTQTEIYCAMDRSMEALENFSKLANLANTHLGSHAAKKYAVKFNDLIYIRSNQPLDSEVRNYKKFLIDKALTKAEGKMGIAAEILGVSSGSLSQKTIEQFPELRVKFGLDRRARRLSKNSVYYDDTCSLDFSHNGQIKPLDISGCQVSYKQLNLPKGTTSYTFILPENMAKAIKLPGECLICVAKESFSSNKPFIISSDSVLHAGITAYEKDLDLFYTIGENNEPVFYESNVLCIGRVAGYCLISDISENKIIFELVREQVKSTR